MYEAALAALVAQATIPRGGLHRLHRVIRSALRSFHARQREAVERLPPEYWIWPHWAGIDNAFGIVISILRHGASAAPRSHSSPDEARTELATADAMLREMGMAFWLPEAERELAGAGG